MKPEHYDLDFSNPFFPKAKSGRKLWCTEIRAVEQLSGERHRFGGPYVPGDSFEDAQDYCNNNGLGYCFVTGEFGGEIPASLAEYAPILLNEGSNN